MLQYATVFFIFMRMSLDRPGQCAELTAYQAAIMERAESVKNVKVLTKVEFIVDVGSRLGKTGDDIIKKAVKDLDVEVKAPGSLRPNYDPTPHYVGWTPEELKELYFVLTGENLAQ